MTPHSISLVQGSFRQVVPIADVAADLFYERLFEVAPALRPMFSTDLGEQKRKLVGMLATAVGGLSQPETIIPAVAGLGRRHAGYGVAPEHYGAVGGALLHALRRGLGEAFTPEVEAAWTQTYGVLAAVMIAASREVEMA